MSNLRIGVRAIPLARLTHTVFFLLTAAYCLLTYNAFAYRQFIKPHLVVWLTDFVIWHHLLYWLQFAVTAATLREEAKAGTARWLVRGYLAGGAVVGLVLLVEPVLPQVENDWRGLMLALFALVPPLWLAACDHAATRGLSRLLPSSEPRLFRACFLGGVIVWAVGTLAAPWRLDRARDIQLSTGSVVFGMAASAVAHAVASALLGLVLLSVIRAARRVAAGRPSADYWALAALSMMAVVATCLRFVFGALAFVGPLAWFVASCLGLTLVLTWSGVARRIVVARGDAVAAMDAWLSPWPGLRSPRQSAAALAVMCVAAVAAVAAVEPIDWDFLFQRVCIIVFWTGACACAYGLLRASTNALPWRWMAGPPAMAAAMLGGTALAGLPAPGRIVPFVPAFVLEGYAAVDPSFQLMYDIARVETAEDQAFYRTLRANSTVEYANVRPMRVDFVSAFPSPPDPPPHVFILLVDSLRRDYVSTYNPKVSFTPVIAQLATESFVFDNAFTRYGGTGLSVPAMWAGGMLLHKQYVTPFAPTNALEKLLDAHGYRRYMSDDHIVTQLFEPSKATTLLDESTPEMDHTLCGTFDELRAHLERDAADPRPVFAMTRPLQLHISRVRSKPVPPGSKFEGFVAPVAAQVANMDRCIGVLLSDLKARGLYDNSVIVIVADHGDSLGEFRRWGHSYTMFPEVARIPLIVRVPDRLRQRFTAQTEGVALSTDVTPTLYALLGHPPADLGPLFGRPLVRLTAEPPAADRGPQLLASSYGAVYVVLRDNGRNLFIADGVNNREYAFDLSQGTPLRVGVTAEVSSMNRGFIREHLAGLARAYDFHPAP